MTKRVPKRLEEILETLRQHKTELAERYGVREMAVFGSYARGEAGPESDLDILVEFTDPPGLIGFIRLENELSELLGVRVELVTRQALKRHIGERILDEAVPA